jgi:cell division protein FtsZ
MPQMGALDAFIPSTPAGIAPVGAPPRDSRHETRPEPSAPPAHPNREPAKVSPMSAAARRAFPSLFDRITARPARAEAKESPRPPQPAAGAAVQTGGMAATVGAKLKADPADRINASAPEDDLLDIPAFLRRQAN